MQVIEIVLEYDCKNDKNKIDKLIKLFTPDNLSKKDYEKSIRAQWNHYATNLKTLAKNRKVLSYERYSEIDYYICIDKLKGNTSQKTQVYLLIFSEYKNIQENVKTIIERLRSIKDSNMSFEINCKSRGKVYIYDSLRKDITGKDIFIEIYFSKEKIFDKVKGELAKVIILICITVIAYLIYNDQIQECYKQLTTATNETIKLFTNTKISIIVNLITGLIGTCLIEFILLIISIIKCCFNNTFKLILKPDIVTECFEEHARQSTFEAIAQGIEDEDEDEIAIDNNVVNGVSR